jgi:hypothetical protein
VVNGGSAKNCRIDFANDGAVTVTGFAFQSGGSAVKPEIDRSFFFASATVATVAFASGGQRP